MKTPAIILIILVLILVGGVGWYYMNHKNNLFPGASPSPSPIATTPDFPTSGPSFCPPDKLQAQITTDAAAGNIFGNITLKNISTETCQILGSNFVEANFDPTVKNITVTHVSQPSAVMFVLAPNQTIYAQIHYPNGPQCQGPVKEQHVSFVYKTSATDTVAFKNKNNSSAEVVQACAGADNTEIQIWAFSPAPITP